MPRRKIILSPERFQLALSRLAHQMIEEFGDFDNCCMIGIQEKGVKLAESLLARIKIEKPDCNIEFGKLDISFYRDDIRLRDTPVKVSHTDILFSLENKKVILVDDVLYTGRTILSGLSALQDFGRPQGVSLLVMVDRRFNRHLPIQPDFSGITVDALDEAYVSVDWSLEHPGITFLAADKKTKA